MTTCHETLSVQQIDHLIHGYVKQSYPHRVPNELLPLVCKLFDDIFRWNIEGEELQRFLKAGVGEYITCTTPYQCNDIRFAVMVAPNGFSGDLGNYGYVRLLVALDQAQVASENIESVTVYHYISSPQCHPLIGKGMNVLDVESAKTWAPHTMKLSDCQNQASLQFNCYIQVLDVEYQKKDKIYRFKQSISIQERTVLEWTVNEEYMELFKACIGSTEMKSFYSPHFDNPNWALMVYPNGDHKEHWQTKGKFYLCLRLLRMPLGIGKVLVDITARYGGFSYFEANCEITRPDGWNSGHQICIFLTQSLADLQSLRFEMQIEIVSVFDRQEKAILKENWRQYGVKSDFTGFQNN